MKQEPDPTESANAPLPVLRGVLPVLWSQVPSEVLAGLTLAALAIPEVIGYSKIAGMPVVTGLYTLLFPLVLFALFGSSRHLVVGADSATAAMLTAGLAGLAAPESAEYVALAGGLALMAAGFLLIARLVRLAFLADFLSRTVLVGFLTGVGIQVAHRQIPGMLGLADADDGSVRHLANVARELEHTNPHALALSISVVIVVVGCRFLSRKIPGALIAVIFTMVASWSLDLASHGVPLVGMISSGPPALAVPALSWSWSLLHRLLPTAFAMFIVILAQSAATSRAYAYRHDEQASEQMDLVGLGLANIGAALSGSFVVNGSPTKTQMVDAAGGRSQLAQLTTAAVILGVLLFLTEPLGYLPEAGLASVVFLIAVDLIDIRQMRRIFLERRAEFWVALTTAAVVVLWSVEQGITLAIFLSLIAHTRHGYHPKNTVLVKSEGKWRSLPVTSPAQRAPGLMIYCFTHSMYYANSELLSEQVRALIGSARPPLRWFCIDCGAVDDVDFSAAQTLLTLRELLQTQGIRLVFAIVSDHVKAELDRSGLTEGIGERAFFSSLGDVAEAFAASNPSAR